MTAPANAMAVMAHRVTPAGEDVDFFPTQPWAARAGAEIIRRLDPRARSAWEPACGAGHMAHGLRDLFPDLLTSDAYLYDGNRVHDFLGEAPPPFGAVDWIVTNPPFSNLPGFMRTAYRQARRGVALLMPSRVLEGVLRHELLYRECPLTVVAPFSERVPMHKGMYDPGRSTAAFYSWFLWLKPALKPYRFMARMPDGAGGWDWRPGVMPIAPGTKKRLFRRSDLRFAVGGEALAIVADRTAKGQPVLAPSLLDLLARVAAEPHGVTPHSTAYPHGLLATLKGMDLIDAGELDPVFGDRRYSVSADGRALLAARGVVW